MALTLVLGGPLVGQVRSVPVHSDQHGLWWTGARAEGDILHVFVDGYHRSVDRGRTWAAVSVPPNWVNGTPGTLASAGRHAYLLWRMVFQSSSDAGATFQAVANPTGLDALASHAVGASCHVLLGATDGNQLNRVIAYVHTVDGGATWSAPVVFGPAPMNPTVRLFVDGTTLHVFWSDGLQILHQRSLDAGATWQAAPTAMQITGSNPGWWDVIVAGTDLHVVNSAGNAIDYIRSLDGGSTWATTLTVPLSVSPTALAGSGPNVYVLAIDGRGSLAVLQSNDRGATWSASPMGNVPLALGFTLAATGNVVGAAWSSLLGTRTIAVSADAGLTWSLAPGGAAGPNANGRGTPTMVLRPPEIAVCWTRQDYWQVLLMLWYPADLDVSADNGRTWHLRQQFGAGGLGGGGWARMVPNQDGLGLLWSDGVDLGGLLNPTDLHYGTVYGFERFGPSKPGTNGIAPRLVPSGPPQPGSAITVNLTDALGSALALHGVSFAGEANATLGSGRLLLAPPVMAFWGTTTAAGVLQLPFTIPGTPALHQQRVTLQGFVLDPNAADGFSSTAGLTMIVL